MSEKTSKEKMSISYSENFLEVSVENFRDYIRNLVYTLQRYENIERDILPKLIDNDMIKKKIDELDKPYYKEIYTFLLRESENIFIMKGTKFVSECAMLMERKYNFVRNGLKNNGENNRYTLTKEAYDLYDHYIGHIDWGKLSDDVYGNQSDETIKTVTEFTESLFKKFNETKFSDSKLEFHYQKLIDTLDVEFCRIEDALGKLKTFNEISTNKNVTNLIVRESIHILILAFLILYEIDMI